MLLPRTKLILCPPPLIGYLIAMECKCGGALMYPGHPVTDKTVVCPDCGEIWEVK